MASPLYAQLPVCSGPGSGKIYYHNGTGIYSYDPALPISGTNPVTNTITLPSGAGGFAVSNNINGAGPSPTFYTTVGNIFYYYNGTSWVSTGHTAGAVNPGAGGGFIYNLNGATGEVYKYDGTGNSILLTTVAGFSGGGPYDLQGDCSGNFYILRTATPQWMRMYSPAGVLLQSWTLTGAPVASAGGGFGIIGNTVVYQNSGLLVGTMTGTNVSFTLVTAAGLTPSPSDFGSCQLGTMVPSVRDTIYYCGNGAGVPVTAQGSAPYNWAVASGPATITGSGSTVTVNTTATSIITRTNSNSVCGSFTGVDTTVIIVPTATVNAGTDHTVTGCGTITDVLNGSISGTTGTTPYTLLWTPAATITAGNTTLNPTITTNTTTTYTLTATAPTSIGGCSFRDSVQVTVAFDTVHADFNFDIHYGCEADTIVLTNLSTNATIHKWDYFDGNGDTVTNPIHVYVQQGNHSIKLVSSNSTCKDSITKAIDTNHPLSASFTLDNDSACSQQLVNFTNTSIATTVNGIIPKFFWDFGDGATDTLQNPAHTYLYAGVYTARLVVKDFVPCYDTAYATIVIDSIPFVNFTTSDTVLCEGQKISFNGNYFPEGFTHLRWSFGDGSISDDINPVIHSYDTSGVFTVSLTASYRLCPDTTFKKDLNITPFPVINLGPDTFLCPNGPAILLADRANTNPAATYLWSTGATTSAIMVTAVGTYSATISANGCTTTDEVIVNKDCYLDIPNSFTANGDGTNDYFFPRQFLSRSVRTFKMSIYNRWGQLLYETSQLDGRGWDGKFNDSPQPQGVYIYIMDVAFANGVKEHYTGNVTLLR